MVKGVKKQKNPNKNSINGEKRFLSGLKHQNVEMFKKSCTVSCRDQQEALKKENIFRTGSRRKHISPSFSLLIFLQLDLCQDQKQTSARMNFCDHLYDVIFLLFSAEWFHISRCWVTDICHHPALTCTSYSVLKVKWNERGRLWLPRTGSLMNPIYIFSIPLCVVGSPQPQPAWWTCAATLWMSRTAPWRSKAVSTAVSDNRLSRPHVDLNRSHNTHAALKSGLKTACWPGGGKVEGKFDKTACKMLRKADEISRDMHREEEHH